MFEYVYHWDKRGKDYHTDEIIDFDPCFGYLSGPSMDSGYNDTCHVELIRGDNVKTIKDLTQGLHIGCFEMLVAPLPSMWQMLKLYVQSGQKHKNQGDQISLKETSQK